MYGPTFPLINVRDIVRAEEKLIASLGIRRLKLAIGASIGGMQVLEWAVLFPERVARAVSIGAAPLGAMGLGLNHLQRQAIMLDPKWAGGYYLPDDEPRGGLAIARALGGSATRACRCLRSGLGGSRTGLGRIRGSRRRRDKMGGSILRDFWTIRGTSSTSGSMRIRISRLRGRWTRSIQCGRMSRRSGL